MKLRRGSRAATTEMPARPNLFTGDGPRVYTIAPHRPFLDDLAAVVADALADPDDPWALADATILVPNRRAVRELTAAFVRATGDAPAASLLPAIRALGDVEEDEPPFEPGELALAAPPAISPARRRFELATLLHARARAKDARADLAASLPLADELALLLDEAATVGGVDFTKVRELYDKLPTHLQESAVFLDIVQTHWPMRLAELDRIDAAKRRVLLMQALADRWRTAPPAKPVIAAGSTGSMTATQEVLDSIARLPKGAVVLPGLDIDLDARAWEEVDHDEGHPQANLKRTLAHLDVARSDVRAWPSPESAPPRAAARRRLINEALRPAPATDDWLSRIAALNAEYGADIARIGLEGLALIAAPTPDAEARAVALAARETLEHPERTVMIVTPDLGLADRIAAALGRFDIASDVSAGRPLIESVPGSFLAHLLRLAREPGDPVALCAVMKHQLTGLGEPHGMVRRRFSEVEREALRGVRAGDDLQAVLAKLNAPARLRDGPASAAARALVEAVEAALAPFAPLAEGEHPLADFAEAHVRAAETFAATEAETGANRLWRDPAGESSAALLRELLEETETAPPVTLSSYVRLFERLASTRAVRAREREEPRVRILGPLEARLQSADLVIVSGLNEGVWPAHATEDPFLSRGMRAAVDLPPPERRLSLAAHDFVQLACAPNVLLTRSLRAETGPSVASRWLWRLQTLVRGAAAGEDALRPSLDYVAVARALDRVRPEEATPARRPEPRPPVAARPRRASASRVREWIRDPYGFYARTILELEPLRGLDEAAGPRERGDALHAALHAVVDDCRDALPDDFGARVAARAVAELKRLGFGDTALLAETERMARAGAWIERWERARRAEGWAPKLMETRGVARIETPGGAFEINARADRIDAGPTGAAILDYKTGSPPSDKAAAQSLEPQMGVEAAIMALGGYPDMPAEPPVELVYVRVRGGRTPGEDRSLFAKSKDMNVAGYTAEALDGLAERIIAFDDPNTAYLSRVAPFKANEVLDFDRLARVKEWADPGEEEA